MRNHKPLTTRLWHAWRTLPQASPQRWFVVLAILFGTVFAVIVPAYDPPDEYGHLSRAWQIGHGHLLGIKNSNGTDTGGSTPNSFTDLGKAARAPDFSLSKLTDLGHIPLNAKVQHYHGFPNLVVYSPVVYAPQAVGLDIGDVLHLPVFYTFILARLCNVIAYALLFYWAIRLLPFGKWLGVIIGLLPMHILLAGSVSADAVTDGLIAITVAAVLYLRHRAKPLTRKHYIWLLALAAALSLTKLPLPLLLGLYLLLPVTVMGGTTKKRWAMLGGAALMALLVGGGWLWLATKTMVPYGPPGVNNAAQIHGIIYDPLHFISAFFTTYGTSLSNSFTQTYVISVGPVAAWLPIWASYIYTTFLIMSFAHLRTTSPAVLRGAQKTIAAGISLLVFVAISVLLYISWTPVNLSHIEGIQARYFTPLLLLLIPLLATQARKREEQEGMLSQKWYRYVPLAYLFLGVLGAFYYFYTLKIVVPF